MWLIELVYKIKIFITVSALKIKKRFTLFIYNIIPVPSLYSANEYAMSVCCTRDMCFHPEHNSPFHCPGFDNSSIETHQVLAALH